MKRIITACLEQTIKFETGEEFEAFKGQMERRGVKFKVISAEFSAVLGIPENEVGRLIEERLSANG